MRMTEHVVVPSGGEARIESRDGTAHGSGRGRTVLVVEDSDIIRRVLTLILESEGYRVVESAGGGDAVELAREQRPDVITLDLSLPDVDGREVLRRLGADESLRSVPVVVLSAFADTLSSAERWHAADVIVKPFDLDDLLVRLERAASRVSDGEGGIGRSA
jgi:CheY-like chemotaxis protein